MTGLIQLKWISLREDQVWYVAHPLRPTEKERSVAERDAAVFDEDEVAPLLATNRNITRAKRWLAWLRATYPAITFIAPWITAVESGADDRDPEQRARGLRDDTRVVRRCDGIVLCGGHVSSGMQLEAERAANIIDLTSLGPEPPR